MITKKGIDDNRFEFKSLAKKIKVRVNVFMEEKIEVCKNVLSKPKNRLSAGLILLGLGVGLIASAYITLPN